MHVIHAVIYGTVKGLLTQVATPSLAFPLSHPQIVMTPPPKKKTRNPQMVLQKQFSPLARSKKKVHLFQFELLQTIP